MITIKIQDIEHIREAAREFIEHIGDHRVFAFYGKMGAGKTTFVKAICEELGVDDVITSPTFAIVNEYTSAKGDSIFHLIAPMALVVLTLLLNRLTRWRFWFFLGSLLLLCYAVLMIQNALAATNFTYTPLLAMIPLFLSAILPLGALAFIKQK